MTYMARTERRAAILDAAIAVMLRDGLAAMTTRAVAAELGASNGIIHHHFSSAGDLRRDAFARYLETELAEFDRRLPDLEPMAALRLMLEDFAPNAPDQRMRLWAEAWGEAQRDQGFAGVYAAAFRDWHERLVRIIAAGVAAGACRKPQDEAVTAWRILALALGLSTMGSLSAELIDLAAGRRALNDAIELELAPSA
jgi:AcrR family transcriptional regulator